MSTSAGRAQPARGLAAPLSLLLLIIALVGVLALPACTDRMMVHEMASVAPSSSELVAVHGTDQTARHLACNDPSCFISASSHHAHSGSEGSGSGKGMLIACLLLLLAVLVAGLWLSPLRPWYGLRPAERASLRSAQREPFRLTLAELCVLRT